VMLSIIRFAAVTLLFAATSAAPASAQEADELRQEMEELKDVMREMQTIYEERIRTLEERIGELEDEPEVAEEGLQVPPRTDGGLPEPVRESARPSPPAGRAAADYADKLSYQSGPISAQIGFNLDVSGGGSSAPDEILKSGETGLQGGGHDPNRNGFTLQAAELAAAGSVDPFFDAQGTMLFLIDQDGETVVELEEAWAATRGLPAGLKVRAGQYYTEFGRKNMIHVHAQDFADQPFIITRMFGGDGQRAPGAELSWLSPLPWFSEFTFGLQNCNGETMPSFCGEDEGIGGFENEIEKMRNFSDAITYSGRWLNGFQLSETLAANVGVSGLYGPNRTGNDNNTWIIGGDVFAKWQPERTERGFPFVSWETEVIFREFEAGSGADFTELEDWGLYTQALWGFHPGWVAGLRFEYGDGDGDSREGDEIVAIGDDLNRAERYRISPNITWYPTEFSKVRLQYNHDWSEALPAAEIGEDGGAFGSHTADTLWLQLGIALGAHGAHRF